VVWKQYFIIYFFNCFHQCWLCHIWEARSLTRDVEWHICPPGSFCRKGFLIEGWLIKRFILKYDPCDLDLWPREPTTNQHVKYESSVINSFQDNERKPFGLPTEGRIDGRTDGRTNISKTIYKSRAYCKKCCKLFSKITNQCVPSFVCVP